MEINSNSLEAQRIQQAIVQQEQIKRDRQQEAIKEDRRESVNSLGQRVGTIINTSA